MSSLGQGTDWDPEEFDSVVEVIPAFKFGIFLTVLEGKYAKDIDEGGMREAIRDIHDYFVKDILKKGYLGRKMDILPAFREHFFVLQPQVRSYIILGRSSGGVYFFLASGGGLRVGTGFDPEGGYRVGTVSKNFFF